MLLGSRLAALRVVLPDDDDSTGLGSSIEGSAKVFGVTKDDLSAILRIR